MVAVAMPPATGEAAQRRAAKAVVATPQAAATTASPRQPLIEVYKDATCGCCSLWVQHLRRNGFAATATNVPDINTVKDQHRVPKQARSCHTGLVGRYVIEGHVPAADVHRLLKEKPDILGLAVPGMPIGSPGMDGAGGKPYDVLALHKDGHTSVYSTQRP
jgi:hypothetical protein